MIPMSPGVSSRMTDDDPDLADAVDRIREGADPAFDQYNQGTPPTRGTPSRSDGTRARDLGRPVRSVRDDES